ncbi:hypothetical protein [Hydrocarboniphaga effusa]|uniref:hypothetical protein n=1 Tax=Hydrocarboniphaga effusa TaxID=243629 RepID=UPI003BAB8DE8
MSRLLEEMTTVNWWLSVVVVGVAINLVSGPIGRLLSRLFSALSSKWRNRTDRKRSEEARLLQELIENPAKIEGERDRAMRRLVAGVLVLMVALALLSFEISDAFNYMMDRKSWVFLEHGTPRGFIGAILIVASVGEASSAIGILDRVLRARKALGHLLQMPEPSRLAKLFRSND